MLRDIGNGTSGRFLGPFPSGEFVQVVAEGAKRAEGFLVEQPLGAAAEANLVRISLPADRPTHLAVPAAAESQHRRSRQAACHDSGPPPIGPLEFFWFFLLDWLVHQISGSSFSLLFKIGQIASKGKI